MGFARAITLLHQHVVRYALRHRGLAAVNVGSVALGAAVFLAVQIVNSSATHSFEAGVDVVAGRAHLEARGRLPADLWPRLRNFPGCTAATPLLEGLVTLPDFPGEYLHIFGVDPFTNGPFETFKLAGGDRAPFQAGGTEGNFDADRWFGDPSAVAISRTFADRHGLRPGDAFRAVVGDREVTLRASFFLDVGDADPRFAAMDLGWAQALFGQPNGLSAVLFRLADPRHPEPTVAALAAVLPKDASVRSPEQRSAQIANLLSGFQLNLTAMSMVSLLVGVFLIYNTVTASAVRRRPEIGLLRAVGASPALVRGLFLGEGALYGALGGILGCVLGIFLAQALVRSVGRTISNLYVLTSIERLYVPLWEVPCVLALGVGSALLGAWLPADAAARLPTLEALHPGAAPATRRRQGRFAWVGLSAASLALAAGCAGLAFSWNRLAGFGCALFTLTGFCALSPPVTAASARLFAGALRRFHVWRIASRNLSRSVGHHAVTIAALAAAVAMLVSVSVMIFSFRSAVDRWVQRRLVADVFVTPAENEVVGFGSAVAPDFLERLRHLPEVESVDTYRDANVTANGQPVALGVVVGSPRSRPEFVGGNDSAKFARFFEPDTVLVSEPLARRLRLRDGENLELLTPGGPRPFRVGGVFYDYTRDAGVMLMARPNYERYWHDPAVNSVALYLRPGTDVDALMDAVRRTEPRAKFYELRSNANLRRLVGEIFNQTFGVTYALRFVALLVALIGIVLNLTVIAKERERELAVIRSLGASRTQVASLMLAEATLLSGVALALGLVAGCALAVVLTEVINKAFFGWTVPLQFPWEQLALTPFLLLPAAFLGGLWPAWQAANLPVIRALREAV